MDGDKLYKIPGEVKDYVQNILTLSYYHCFIGSKPDGRGYYTVATNCGPEVFQKVVMRATMEKKTEELHTEEFYCVTQEELDDLFFITELKKVKKGCCLIADYTHSE